MVIELFCSHSRHSNPKRTVKMVLITGAPGWLGTRFVRIITQQINEFPNQVEPYLDQPIRCLILNNIDPKQISSISSKIDLCTGDVRFPATMEDFFSNAEGGTLFHLVGLIHPKKIKDLYEVNTEGVRNVVDLAVKAGIKRIVAISSNSPIGCNPSNESLFNENSNYNPYMNYGIAKKLAEDILNEAHQYGEIETVIIRPCWFYGPDQPPRQTEFFRMIKNGKCPIVGAGNNKRSMSYIDNTCQGLLLAGRIEKAQGNTYWIADRRPYTMNEIADTVEEILEKEFGFSVKHKRLFLPNATSEVALLIDWIIQRLGVYNQKIHVLSEMNKTIACSIEKAKKELGYIPTVELEEGMRRSIHWVLSNYQKL